MKNFKRITSSLMTRIVLGLVLLGSAACQQQDERGLAMQRLLARSTALASTFGECERDSIAAIPALVARSRCLLFTTSENPAAADGRKIQLQVMVVPSIRQIPEPDPFVILVGGPGQAATVDALPLLPFFQEIRQNRDILLVDQRGTGRLSPFDCEFGEAEMTGSTELLLELQNRYLEDCLASIDAQPEYYTTDIAVQDLDAIRSYLGYSELNLWGISYGTRVALTYLKYFPDNTRTVVIDGVAPPGVLPLEAARDGGRALRNVFPLCAAQMECAAAFPDLKSHYDELIARYVTPVSIDLPDPKTGIVKPLELQASLIQGGLFTLLYSRETTRLIPLFIEQLHQGNFQMLTALTAPEAGVNIGMHYSVICSEDIPLLAPDELASASEDGDVFVYDMLVLPRVEGCKVWPSRALDAEFFAPVVSDKPALIFSASQDPVTPRRWGDQVAATLGNSRHFVVSGIGHGVFAYGCAVNMITAVVNSGEVEGLDGGCLDELAPRPFFVNPGGSAPADD